MPNTNKRGGEELTVWGAVGPNGHVVKSSIGIFKAVANRWALRRGNYEVVKLGTIRSPGMETADEAAEEVAAANEAMAAAEGSANVQEDDRGGNRGQGGRGRSGRGGGPAPRRKRGRPSKADIAAREAQNQGR